jgi:hypothetical protein
MIREAATHIRRQSQRQSGPFSAHSGDLKLVLSTLQRQRHCVSAPVAAELLILHSTGHCRPYRPCASNEHLAKMLFTPRYYDIDSPWRSRKKCSSKGVGGTPASGYTPFRASTCVAMVFVKERILLSQSENAYMSCSERQTGTYLEFSTVRPRIRNWTAPDAMWTSKVSSVDHALLSLCAETVLGSSEIPLGIPDGRGRAVRDPWWL